jgi:hypothetical protein
VHFEVVGEISNVELIAEGAKLRMLRVLEKLYGKGRWRKVKGTATIRLQNGRIHRAELHWYEAHGIGRRRMKFKRYLD